jgi:hypothetical protein
VQAVAKAAQAMEKKKKEEVSVIDPAKSRNLAITLGSIKVCPFGCRARGVACIEAAWQLSLTSEPAFFPAVAAG